MSVTFSFSATSLLHEFSMLAIIAPFLFTGHKAKTIIIMLLPFYRNDYYTLTRGIGLPLLYFKTYREKCPSCSGFVLFFHGVEAANV